MLFYDLFRQDPTFIKIQAGQCLFREGDVGKEMYVLIEGQASLDIGGVPISEYGQGDLMGEMAVIDGSLRYGTVTALTDCKFVVIDEERFHFLIEQTPGFSLEVIRVISKRLKECDLRVVNNATGSPS